MCGTDPFLANATASATYPMMTRPTNPARVIPNWRPLAISKELSPRARSSAVVVSIGVGWYFVGTGRSAFVNRYAANQTSE